MIGRDFLKSNVGEIIGSAKLVLPIAAFVDVSILVGRVDFRARRFCCQRGDEEDRKKGGRVGGDSSTVPFKLVSFHQHGSCNRQVE
jgi:hypothetical protein